MENHSTKSGDYGPVVSPPHPGAAVNGQISTGQKKVGPCGYDGKTRRGSKGRAGQAHSQ
ncbi:MAG: hypothetical protein K2F83_03735 [Oscillospiraceae bacterium]|nr:hypothetical protein [Oscillospiraceae bacterium]